MSSISFLSYWSIFSNKISISSISTSHHKMFCIFCLFPNSRSWCVIRIPNRLSVITINALNIAHWSHITNYILFSSRSK